MIQQAKESYNSLASFRRKRERCRDYTFGRQWNDTIEINGRRVSEYEYILSEGNVPLKNNLIRRLVRNVIGVFRERLPKIMEKEYSGELSTVAQENSLTEIFSRTMEEFLISGMAVIRKRLCHNNEGPGIRSEIVSPSSFFFNTDSHDVRGWDINLIGQIHSVDFTEWCRAFVKTRSEFEKARDLFPDSRRHRKVIEIWHREPVPRYIIHDESEGYVYKCAPDKLSFYPKDWPRKWSLEEIWRYEFLDEDGKILVGGESPYLDGSHPYVMKCYPFLDGEIQSFVGDLIDQQRYTNRLITLYDWVIRASAKGVLLIPEGSVSTKNIRGVADQWSRFNGVIVYNSDPNRPEPKQISGTMSNLGISELLEIQLKMLEDVSGVNGILQGNKSGSNVSGELYKTQTTNAMYSLADLLETFRCFIHDSAVKDRMLLRQHREEGGSNKY